MKVVVGDLYPTSSERALILGGIERYCGVPHGRNGNPGHWDNWREVNGKHHKGSAVDALEKARINPEDWGIEDNFPIEGGQPPSRPVRDVSQLTRAGSTFVHSGNGIGHTPNGNTFTPFTPAGGPLAPFSLHGMSGVQQGVSPDMVQQLLFQKKQLEAQLHQQQLLHDQLLKPRLLHGQVWEVGIALV